MDQPPLQSPPQSTADHPHRWRVVGDDGSSRLWLCAVCLEQHIQFRYPQGSTLPAFSPECARPSH